MVAVLSHRISKMREICLLWLPKIPKMPTGCPIAAQESSQIDFAPQDRPPQREEPYQAVSPLRCPRQETQKHVDQQRHPDLPSHRVGAVPQEISQLQRLLDLLEEYLDLPPASIEIGHRLRAPLKIVRQEDHLPFLPIHLNQRHDPASMQSIHSHDLLVGQ